MKENPHRKKYIYISCTDEVNWKKNTIYQQIFKKLDLQNWKLSIVPTEKL